MPFISELVGLENKTRVFSESGCKAKSSCVTSHLGLRVHVLLSPRWSRHRKWNTVVSVVLAGVTDNSLALDDPVVLGVLF